MKNAKITLNQFKYLTECEYYKVYYNGDEIFDCPMDDEISFYETYGQYYVEKMYIDEYDKLLILVITEV